jgi:hypothetical protein
MRGFATFFANGFVLFVWNDGGVRVPEIRVADACPVGFRERTR